MKLTKVKLKKIIAESILDHDRFLSTDALDSLKASWKNKAQKDIQEVFLVHWRYPEISQLSVIKQIFSDFDRRREIVANGFPGLPLISTWAAENPGENVGVLLQGEIECAFKRDVESFSRGRKLYPRVSSVEEFWNEAALSVEDLPQKTAPLHNEFFVSNWNPIAIIFPNPLREAIREYPSEFSGFEEALRDLSQLLRMPILDEFGK